ncbi:hypothetical protein GCM10009549_49130 [Streptomyces thermoalcalitolerans]|uniref:Uncharacterized protein n=1 Tax=Streptomyces thermoalcalitolerans TaxID=65605 RepID=A0ABP3ZU46_9ACTN
MLSHADGTDAEYFHEICNLVPQLADSSVEVVDFLRKSVAAFTGELHQAAADALKEAEEVAREGHMR